MGSLDPTVKRLMRPHFISNVVLVIGLCSLPQVMSQILKVLNITVTVLRLNIIIGSGVGFF